MGSPMTFFIGYTQVDYYLYCHDRFKHEIQFIIDNVDTPDYEEEHYIFNKIIENQLDYQNKQTHVLKSAMANQNHEIN